MRRLFQSLRLLFAACVLTACTPARTGIIGNTLTTNVKPSISITGLNSLTVQAHGRLYPDSGRALTPGASILSFDYAFFTDETQPDCFAYAAIVRISNEERWIFHPPTRFAEAFSTAEVSFGGFQWSEQLLRSSCEKDWPSAVWEELEGKTHKYWLTKRWIAHLDGTTRAVMEYREPWPEAMVFLNANAVVFSEKSGDTLTAFIKRADTAFSVEQKGGDFSKNALAPRPATTSVPINVIKLVGEVFPVDHN